jgi:hypothetical protein
VNLAGENRQEHPIFHAWMKLLLFFCRLNWFLVWFNILLDFFEPFFFGLLFLLFQFFLAFLVFVVYGWQGFILLFFLISEISLISSEYYSTSQGKTTRCEAYPERIKTAARIPANPQITK